MIIYRIDLKLKQTFSLFYKDYKKKNLPYDWPILNVIFR